MKNINELKDTLQLYDELREAGVPEAQARAQAKQLGAFANLSQNLLHEVKTGFAALHKDIFWIKVIGAAMVGAVAYLYLHINHLM